MSHPKSNVRRLELVGGRADAKLPQYMFRRGDPFYFKRKIPAGAAAAFPGYKEQVWKSLETNLLTKAKVRLAVEVTEFNLTLAAFQRKKATQEAQQANELRQRGTVLACIGAVASEAQLHVWA